jgi:hypothetical protein
LQPVRCMMSLTVFPPLPMTRPAYLSGTSTALATQGTARSVSASSQGKGQGTAEMSRSARNEWRTCDVHTDGRRCGLLCRLLYLRQRQSRLLSLPNRYWHWTSLPSHCHYHCHWHWTSLPSHCCCRTRGAVAAARLAAQSDDRPSARPLGHLP